MAEEHIKIRIPKTKKGVTEVEDKISHMTDLLMGTGIASEVLLERSERRNSLVI